MKNTYFIGMIAVITLLAGSTMLNAEIASVINGNFESDGPWVPPSTGWTTTTIYGSIFTAPEDTGINGPDNGPGAGDMYWLCLALFGTESGDKMYQDLGTTTADGLYVAQIFLQNHGGLYYDLPPVKLSLRNAATDAELAFSGNAEAAWVIPGALVPNGIRKLVYGECIFQATSAVNLRVQLENVTVPGNTQTQALNADDIRVVNELLGAHYPSPARRALDVSTGAVLSWTAGTTGGITGHNVYLGTDPEFMTKLNASPLAVGTTTYDPDLNPNTIYFWRVDEVTGAGTITGTIWSFRTELTGPIIEGVSGGLGTLGGDVSWTVTATDPSGTGLSYQWYYDPNTLVGNDEVALSDGTDYTGTDTATLTLLGLEESDLGKKFFCAVSNVAFTVNTDYVEVKTPRLVYYWPFDNSYAEVKSNTPLEASLGNPTFVTGKVGQALEVDGEFTSLHYKPVNLYFADASYPDSERYDPALYGWSTISFWVNSYDVTSDWGTFFSAAPGFIMCMGHLYDYNEGWVRLTQTLTYPPAYDTTAEFDMVDIMEENEWYHFAIRTDTGKTTFFQNGVIIGEHIHDRYSQDQPIGDGEMWFGQLFWASEGSYTGWFKGAIDEFKIYNYPLSDREIAQEYADGAGVAVCVPTNPANIVEDGSCVIDLADFAALAAEWLADLNVYPTP